MYHPSTREPSHSSTDHDDAPYEQHPDTANHDDLEDAYLSNLANNTSVEVASAEPQLSLIDDMIRPFGDGPSSLDLLRAKAAAARKRSEDISSGFVNSAYPIKAQLAVPAAAPASATTDNTRSRSKDNGRVTAAHVRSSSRKIALEDRIAALREGRRADHDHQSARHPPAAVQLKTPRTAPSSVSALPADFARRHSNTGTLDVAAAATKAHHSEQHERSGTVQAQTVCLQEDLELVPYDPENDGGADIRDDRHNEMPHTYLTSFATNSTQLYTNPDIPLQRPTTAFYFHTDPASPYRQRYPNPARGVSGGGATGYLHSSSGYLGAGQFSTYLPSTDLGTQASHSAPSTARRSTSASNVRSPSIDYTNSYTTTALPPHQSNGSPIQLLRSDVSSLATQSKSASAVMPLAPASGGQALLYQRGQPFASHVLNSAQTLTSSSSLSPSGIEDKEPQANGEYQGGPDNANSLKPSAEDAALDESGNASNISRIGALGTTFNYFGSSANNQAQSSIDKSHQNLIARKSKIANEYFRTVSDKKAADQLRRVNKVCSEELKLRTDVLHDEDDLFASIFVIYFAWATEALRSTQKERDEAGAKNVQLEQDLQNLRVQASETEQRHAKEVEDIKKLLSESEQKVKAVLADKIEADKARDNAHLLDIGKLQAQIQELADKLQLQGSEHETESRLRAESQQAEMLAQKALCEGLAIELEGEKRKAVEERNRSSSILQELKDEILLKENSSSWFQPPSGPSTSLNPAEPPRNEEAAPSESIDSVINPDTSEQQQPQKTIVDSDSVVANVASNIAVSLYNEGNNNNEELETINTALQAHIRQSDAKIRRMSIQREWLVAALAAYAEQESVLRETFRSWQETCTRPVLLTEKQRTALAKATDDSLAEALASAKQAHQDQISRLIEQRLQDQGEAERLLETEKKNRQLAADAKESQTEFLQSQLASLTEDMKKAREVLAAQQIARANLEAQLGASNTLQNSMANQLLDLAEENRDLLKSLAEAELQLLAPSVVSGNGPLKASGSSNMPLQPQLISAQRCTPTSNPNSRAPSGPTTPRTTSKASYPTSKRTNSDGSEVERDSASLGGGRHNDVETIRQQQQMLIDDQEKIKALKMMIANERRHCFKLSSSLETHQSILRESSDAYAELLQHAELWFQQLYYLKKYCEEVKNIVIPMELVSDPEEVIKMETDRIRREEAHEAEQRLAAHLLSSGHSTDSPQQQPQQQSKPKTILSPRTQAIIDGGRDSISATSQIKPTVEATSTTSTNRMIVLDDSPLQMADTLRNNKNAFASRDTLNNHATGLGPTNNNFDTTKDFDPILASPESRNTQADIDLSNASPAAPATAARKTVAVRSVLPPIDLDDTSSDDDDPVSAHQLLPASAASIAPPITTTTTTDEKLRDLIEPSQTPTPLLASPIDTQHYSNTKISQSSQPSSSRAGSGESTKQPIFGSLALSSPASATVAGIDRLGAKTGSDKIDGVTTTKGNLSPIKSPFDDAVAADPDAETEPEQAETMNPTPLPPNHVGTPSPHVEIVVDTVSDAEEGVDAHEPNETGNQSDQVPITTALLAANHERATSPSPSPLSPKSSSAASSSSKESPHDGGDDTGDSDDEMDDLLLGGDGEGNDGVEDEEVIRPYKPAAITLMTTDKETEERQVTKPSDIPPSALSNSGEGTKETTPTVSSATVSTPPHQNLSSEPQPPAKPLEGPMPTPTAITTDLLLRRRSQSLENRPPVPPPPPRR